MSTMPDPPKVARGGVVLVDPPSGRPLRTIRFQYNPDTLTRTLQPQGIGGEPGDRQEALRLKGPPHETYKLDAEFDAAEQLADPDTNVLESTLRAAPRARGAGVRALPVGESAPRREPDGRARHDRDGPGRVADDGARARYAPGAGRPAHRADRDRGRLRHPAQPDPRQGLDVSARAHRRRPRLRPPRRAAVPRPPPGPGAVRLDGGPHPRRPRPDQPSRSRPMFAATSRYDALPVVELSRAGRHGTAVRTPTRDPRPGVCSQWSARTSSCPATGWTASPPLGSATPSRPGGSPTRTGCSTRTCSPATPGTVLRFTVASGLLPAGLAGAGGVDG